MAEASTLNLKNSLQMEAERRSVSLAVPLTFSLLVSVSLTVRLFKDLTCSWVCVSHRVLHHRRHCPLEVCLTLLFSMPASIAGCTCVRLPCWHMLLKSPLLLPLWLCWEMSSGSLFYYSTFTGGIWVSPWRSFSLLKGWVMWQYKILILWNIVSPPYWDIMIS